MATDEGKREEKRPAVHEVAIKLLKEIPQASVGITASMHAAGAVVPAKDIPELIEAFKEAKASVIELIYEAIRVLNKQLYEAKRKEKEGKEG